MLASVQKRGHQIAVAASTYIERVTAQFCTPFGGISRALFEICSCLVYRSTHGQYDASHCTGWLFQNAGKVMSDMKPWANSRAIAVAVTGYTAAVLACAAPYLGESKAAKLPVVMNSSICSQCKKPDNLT